MSFKKIIFVLSVVLFSNQSFAGFPQDFSDVVWTDADASSFAETSFLEPVTVSGGLIRLEHSKRNSWPLTRRFSASQNVNASVWGFVQLNGIWHAGTWEFMRRGVTTRSVSAFGGAGHFRPPIGTFRPTNGVVYGFMMSGAHRDGFQPINVRERTNVQLHRWGVGPVAFDPAEPEEEEATPIDPILNTLLDDE